LKVEPGWRPAPLLRAKSKPVPVAPPPTRVETTPRAPVVINYEPHFAAGAIVVPGAIPDGDTLLASIDGAVIRQARAAGGSSHRGALGLVAALGDVV